jgi:8-oxo-dGTP pyrophosphatase MutT (NUDIX family)
MGQICSLQALTAAAMANVSKDRRTMSTGDVREPEQTAARIAAKRMRPRDAATLIIVDRTGREPRVLMGKRRMEQVFMPGKYVFPGGRVDRTDRLVASADELSDADTAKLLLEMKGTTTVSRARALALAAIRETYEEAGLVIGSPVRAQPVSKPVPGWAAFHAHGFVPRLSPLTFLARAITPPGRTRRYDTRFFCMDATAIIFRTETNDGELSGLHWLTMADARNLDLPSITRVVLEDLTERLHSDGLYAPTAHVPFYHHHNGSFRRDMLTWPQPKP